MAKRPELQIVNGELAGRKFVVGAGGVRLGRSSSNDIHISDGELSRNHCLFEPLGEDGIRLTDLASANGTVVNGALLGGDPVDIVVGDEIQVGSTIIKVVGDNPPVVDLGLEPKSPQESTDQKKRSPFSLLLRLLAAIAVLGGIASVLLMPQSSEESSPKAIQEEEPVLKEFVYEKVDANSDGIFRYELVYTQDGVLKVTVDDVPNENRHLTKSEILNDQAKEELQSILDFKALREIDREYVGMDTEPPVLSSWVLRVVYSTRARNIRIINVPEPEGFRPIREKLEAFSKNQLGVWALQYSRDKLVELAENAINVAQSRWEDREVQHGNLFASVAAFREALFYLETVNPKPECAQIAERMLKEAQDELEKRYSDQRFLADRAINLGEWETARRELTVLIEMIPDRADDRNREATAKLIDVEKRLKGGKAK